jgi:hypothetical protein
LKRFAGVEGDANAGCLADGVEKPQVFVEEMSPVGEGGRFSGSSGPFGYLNFKIYNK